MNFQLSVIISTFSLNQVVFQDRKDKVLYELYSIYYTIYIINIYV